MDFATLGPGLANGADGLEDPSAAPECHGAEAEPRNQETCIADELVKTSIDGGINFFDTADNYTEGESEKILGHHRKTLTSHGRMS
jgi:aryl-alcohol dehydrogenase-like predicted oxidoreductase